MTENCATMMEASWREEEMESRSASPTSAAAAMGLSLVDFDQQDHGLEGEGDDEDPQHHDEGEGESDYAMQLAPQQQKDEICVTGAAATKTPRYSMKAAGKRGVVALIRS